MGDLQVKGITGELCFYIADSQICIAFFMCVLVCCQEASDHEEGEDADEEDDSEEAGDETSEESETEELDEKGSKKSLCTACFLKS